MNPGSSTNSRKPRLERSKSNSWDLKVKTNILKLLGKNDKLCTRKQQKMKTDSPETAGRNGVQASERNIEYNTESTKRST